MRRIREFKGSEAKLREFMRGGGCGMVRSAPAFSGYDENGWLPAIPRLVRINVGI
jgi:hypothetical protein